MRNLREMKMTGTDRMGGPTGDQTKRNGQIQIQGRMRLPAGQRADLEGSVPKVIKGEGQGHPVQAGVLSEQLKLYQYIDSTDSSFIVHACTE